MQCWDNVYFSTELCALPPVYMLGYILFHCWAPEEDLTDFCVQYKTFLKHLIVCH